MGSPEIHELVADLRDVATGRLEESQFRAKYMHPRAPAVLEHIWGGLAHFLSDADIRAKDAAYREMQERELDRLIQVLLKCGSEEELRHITFLGQSKR